MLFCKEKKETSTCKLKHCIYIRSHFTCDRSEHANPTCNKCQSKENLDDYFTNPSGIYCKSCWNLYPYRGFHIRPNLITRQAMFIWDYGIEMKGLAWFIKARNKWLENEKKRECRAEKIRLRKEELKNKKILKTFDKWKLD